LFYFYFFVLAFTLVLQELKICFTKKNKEEFKRNKV